MHQHLTISELFIYPIKGMSGIALSKSEVTQLGLKYDRRYMIVDEHNQFISQRNFSLLCLFKIEIDEQGFVVSYQGNTIVIPFFINEGESIKVKIWDDEVNAIIASTNINQFLCKHLSINCKLVYMPNSAQRWVDKNVVPEDHIVSFADAYPILLIGKKSLHLLNEKLAEPIEMNRFRPNITFLGGEAHEEDQWINFSVNNVKFKGVKACARCVVTTINQQTGLSSKEPLKTLATYRSFKQKINFGQNVIVLNKGEIAVGDEIILA
jgi:uncharacterized protein YcbX